MINCLVHVGKCLFRIDIMRSQLVAGSVPQILAPELMIYEVL